MRRRKATSAQSAQPSGPSLRAADFWKAAGTQDLGSDEVWSYAGSKQKNPQPKTVRLRYGDAYTFAALERASKLVLRLCCCY